MVTSAPAPRHPVVAAVRKFVDDEVRSVALALEHDDRYPHALVARMRELGLFGCLVPREWDGLGLDVRTYAGVIEELCRGWMSLAGVINSHTMAALIVLHHGTDEQRHRFLPRFARGEARGGLALTEPHAGSDVQAIRTVARRRGETYVLDGTKMFVTNGREGNTFALLALTDPAARPRHRGMSCFVVEKGRPGLRVVKSIAKLGYKGVDTAELLLEDFEVPATNLVGGEEGRGFKHVMSGLETGRLNIAARAVGVAQAAWDAAVAQARTREADGAAVPPALADMASGLATARLVTGWAAGMKDRGERCDLEAGMAKLWATEAAHALGAAALSLQGHDAATTSVERIYRDTPLMIIGEGTNEIQRLLIARQLLARHGERTGALASVEGQPMERRHLVLTVRQLVERTLVDVGTDPARVEAYPGDALARLAELGIMSATVPGDDGGLGLDLVTVAMLTEELGRGSATVATLVAGHLAAAAAIADGGSRDTRERWLPSLARGERLGATAINGTVSASPSGGGWRVVGFLPRVDGAARAAGLVVSAGLHDGRRGALLVPLEATGVRVGPPIPTLGCRGLDAAPVTLDVTVPASSVLGANTERVERATGGLIRLLVAATAVGVAQAAFEAALRYAQQRVAFGQPIAQHQAIQLKLADMATGITATRLLTARAAEDLMPPGADDTTAGLARLHATQTAAAVTLESMRVHGGYGYTREFPVERHYRDAAHLLLAPVPHEVDRASLGRRLAGGILPHHGDGETGPSPLPPA